MQRQLQLISLAALCACRTVPAAAPSASACRDREADLVDESDRLEAGTARGEQRIELDDAGCRYRAHWEDGGVRFDAIELRTSSGFVTTDLTIVAPGEVRERIDRDADGVPDQERTDRFADAGWAGQETLRFDGAGRPVVRYREAPLDADRSWWSEERFSDGGWVVEDEHETLRRHPPHHPIR